MFPLENEYESLLPRNAHGTYKAACTILAPKAGDSSSIGCAPVWFADGRGCDPHVRQHSSVEIGHEIISTAILSLPLIQEGQLSVTGERMCTKN